MISRRKAFNSVCSALGIGGMSIIFSSKLGRAAAPLVADETVAHMFDDADYLRERAARLTAHVNYMAQLDAEDRARRAKDAAEQAVIDSYMTPAIRANGFQTEYVAEMPIAHFELLVRRNMIDHIPNAAGEILIPMFLGHHVKVVS